MPLISIIIPTHNAANTICPALDSICSQRFTDYEVLVIDNMSTDKTPELILPYVSNNSNIRILSQKDKGVYDAMNKGIDLAKGEWLYFLGSDDYLYDDKVLEDMAAIVNEKTLDMVYGDAIQKSSNERYGGQFDTLRIHTKGNLCHQTIFYRKSIFHQLGKYNLQYPVVADWDMNIRCFRHPGIRTFYMNRVIVCYNNKGGISNKPHYDPLYKELPILYVNQLAGSKVYKTAMFVHKILTKIKITRVVKKQMQ